MTLYTTITIRVSYDFEDKEQSEAEKRAQDEEVRSELYRSIDRAVDCRGLLAPADLLPSSHEVDIEIERGSPE
jgi:hypothetical protein